MENARTNNSPTVRRGMDQNFDHAEREADVIFITEWARRYSAKDGAKITGMTPSGFKKLQAGENAISFAKLTHWMRGDPNFAAAYAEHVGLILPGDAEFTGAFTKAVNAYNRRRD